LAYTNTGYGDGSFSVISLLSKGKFVGFEIQFIELN